MATTVASPSSLTPGPIYIDTQHEDLVHDAQMDYYGAKLATCSSDRTIKVYNVYESNYELAATLQGHEGPVWQVSWAHPKFGVLLASCGFDGSVLIHSQTTNSKDPAAAAPAAGAAGATGTASASGSTAGGAAAGAASGGAASSTNAGGGGSGAAPNAAGAGKDNLGKSNHQWSLLHAARQLHESSVNGVAFGPHELGQLWLAAASSDGKVSILKHEPNNTWSVTYVPDACSMGVNAVSWAPYGAYLDPKKASTTAAGATPVEGEAPPAPAEGEAAEESPRLVTAGCDNQIRFWMLNENQVAAGQQWQPDPAPVDTSALRHTDWVRDVAWAPTLLPGHNMVASCSEDCSVIIWKQQGGPTAEWKPTLLHKFEHPVWRVSWSMTGHLLAVSSGDSDVSLWKQGLDGKWTQVTTVEESHAPPSSHQG